MKKIILNFEAEIIPFKGMAGIEFYTHISEYYNVFGKYKFKRNWESLRSNTIVLPINRTMYLVFSNKTGELFGMCALENYKGTFKNGIHTGMNISEALKIDKTLEYDDCEELYYSHTGYEIETSVGSENITSIYIYADDYPSKGDGLVRDQSIIKNLDKYLKNQKFLKYKKFLNIKNWNIFNK